MKLQKWALIAEIVGAVGIVATLIVLIVETPANTGAIAARTAAATFSTSTNVDALTALPGSLARHEGKQHGAISAICR
jgi:hypothetical protein